MIATVLLVAIAVVVTIVGIAALLVLGDAHNDRVDADTARVLDGFARARRGGVTSL